MDAAGLRQASNPDVGDEYGHALALSYDGGTLAVAAALEDSGATGVGGNQADNSQPDAGAAYVFAGAGATWALQAYVKGSTAITGDFFGEGLAIDGDTLAVGSPGDDTHASNGGALYVFARSGTTWTQQAKLYAPDAGANDPFATAVAVAGDVAIAGAAVQNAGTGEAYVFARTQTTWNGGVIVQSTNPGIGDAFGVAVSLAADGSYAVGAFREDSSTTGIASAPDDTAMDAGAAYTWTY